MFGVEGINSWPRIFLFLYSLTGILAQELVNVTIIINGSDTIAQTDDNFVCATLDWWPPEKCNYNQCPWGMSSIINLDTNHPSLAKAIQAFNPLRIRVGGTLQDQVVYGVSSLGYPCVPFAKKEGKLFGFSRGCLSMERWDTLNNLFQKTGYLDQLGMSAKYNTRVYCRQALVGGNYGLLTKNNFIPNPDYYNALLWHRLIGKGVFSVDINGSSFLRAYAHCSKQKAGITLLLINLSNNTEFNISIQNDTKADLGNGSSISKERSFIHGIDGGSKSPDGGSKRREEYHLTPKDGNHQSQIVLLNGKALKLTEDGGIPALNPASVDANSPISIAPFSIKFVFFPYAEVQACM